MDAGDLDGALRAFDEAVRLDPALEWAWFNLGLVHKFRRDWKEAARCNRAAAARSSGAAGSIQLARLC